MLTKIYQAVRDIQADPNGSRFYRDTTHNNILRYGPSPKPGDTLPNEALPLPTAPNYTFAWHVDFLMQVETRSGVDMADRNYAEIAFSLLQFPGFIPALP